MKDIRTIIAENLVSLRKKAGLTQTELAEKLNYSDNTVSRWERAELTPTVETLEQIAQIYNVDLGNLLKENVIKIQEKNTRMGKIKKLATILGCFSLVWLVAIIVFFQCETFFGFIFWEIFIWAIPVSFIVLLCFSFYYKGKVYKFVMSSCLVWTFLLSLYIQFLENNLWLFFIIGIPLQVSLAIWTFMRPRENKEKK